MRYLVFGCAFFIACAKDKAPVQDPLDYLRVGVDPREEAAALTDDLRRNGFRVGRRFEEPTYVAFDAARGPDALVRVVSTRGVVLTVQAPDVRWPERLWVELGPEPRPDFDRDGQGDVVVLLRERDRTCLAWAQVDRNGFASDVFRPLTDWGDAPCVLEIDPARLRLLLELSVPDSPVPGARVRVPVRAQGRSWVLDDSAEAQSRWDLEIAEKGQLLEELEKRGDSANATRLRAELEWLDRLRTADEPMLQPADDGEEAR
jgi:hypothetical protein